MTETTLKVPDIHCGHCKSSIEGAVGEVPGVHRVDVDIPSASVAVTHDQDLDLSTVVAAIESQGYEVASN